MGDNVKYLTHPVRDVNMKYLLSNESTNKIYNTKAAALAAA